MLTKYLQAAMKRAKYEILPEDKGYYGEIPGFQGVYANSDTLERCREELREVLEGWVMLSLAKGLPMPVVDGIDINVKQTA
ncbi:MAG: type II toxin-antitoxin system HicB family antitoxin [SAR202 cluster bacterium]|nr:type II toxin-antitoxin system HicB family antitoxin [SAR202 cluster bacterium]